VDRVEGLSTYEAWRRYQALLEAGSFAAADRFSADWVKANGREAPPRPAERPTLLRSNADIPSPREAATWILSGAGLTLAVIAFLYEPAGGAAHDLRWVCNRMMICLVGCTLFLAGVVLAGGGRR
jgi:hypothetical protein